MHTGIHTERFIASFDSTELFVETWGDPSGTTPPLVLCDGLGCDGFVWRHLIPAFSDRYPLVHFHYRSHGLSGTPRAEGAVSVEDLCGDVLAVLDALSIPKAVLLGHSMSVQVVLEFALQQSARTAAVVPICGSYGRPLDTFHDSGWAKRAFPALWAAVERFPRGAQQIWTRGLLSEAAFQFAMRVELNGRLIKRQDFEPYFQHLAGMNVRDFFGVLRRLQEHTVEDRLPQLEAPTLVVAGEDDTFTPAWLSTRMAQLIPQAELLMIPGGTHAAPIEHPELTHLRLLRFLEERVQPAEVAPRKAKAPARKRAPRRAAAAASGTRSKKNGAAAKGKKAPARAKSAAPAKKARGTKAQVEPT